jgi:hypothetical protein
MTTTIPTVVYLFPLNTQLLQVQGLQDFLSGDYLNSATVLATLLDYRGNPDSVLQNIPMNYVAGSNGNYTGIVPDTFNAPLGSGYILQITADQAGVQGQWSIPAQVKPRARC